MSDFSFNANQENEFWNKQAERADLEQQKRLENRQRFGVELNDEEYAQINNLIADSENPDQEAHKLGSALLYSKQLGMPIEEAYANIDNYNEALWGTEKSKNYRNSFTAIADMFVIGNNGLKLGNLGNQLQQAEYDGDEEAIKNIIAEIDAINADNELRADNTPRPWYVEALKCGAQTLPFTGEAALVGLFGNFITPGLGTALAFGSSSSLASGQEYIDMRKEGISPETASKVSMMSGAIQGLIEVSLGETTNYLAAGATKTLSKTAAGEIGAKVAENFAKRFHYGPGKKAAVSVASAWAADKFGEGLEEATQELTSIIADEVARSMDGLSLDDATISDKVKQITDAFKGGVVGAIVLGLPFDVANVNANVKDYQSVRATAENIPSEEMFKEAVKDSPVFSNMSDDKKSSVIHDIFENVQLEKENEETLRAKEIAEVNKAGDSFENVTVDEETGEAEVEAEYRDENGKLNIQNDIESNENGIVKGSYRLGNPEQAENNLYGYINYTVDENNKTVTIEAGDFGLSNARENLRQEFYDNFARDYAGYDIQWNTIGTKANDIKQQLINRNPRGKNNGLNYYDSVEGVSLNDTRKKVAAQIKNNMPNLSNDEVSAAVVVLEAGAKGLGKNITEYVNDTFGGQIFGDLSEIEEIAQKQGTTFQNKAGASTWKGFGRQMKAVIYAGQYADFSTWCHELAHVYQAQLTGDLKKEAEKAFNVVNGDWYNSKVIGKDGKEMASNEAFAYGFQDWLKTGKAQSQEQVNIFQKFAQFISRCLNSLKDFINISPEIESVYSKLLQADDSMLRAAENAVKEQDAEARRAEIVRKSNEEKQKAQQEKQSQETEQEENTADSEITIAEEAANETDSNELTNEEEKNKTFRNVYYNIYPELDDIINHHQFNNNKLTFTDLKNILQEIIKNKDLQNEINIIANVDPFKDITGMNTEEYREAVRRISWELNKEAIRNNKIKIENTENQVKKAVDSVVTPTLTEEEKQAATGVLSDSEASLEDKNTVISDITEDEHIELDALFQSLGPETIQMLAESPEKTKILKDLEKAVEYDTKFKHYSPNEKAYTIKRLTGWEKNPAGEWKYETDDDASWAQLNAKFSKLYKNNAGFRNYINENRVFSLGEVLENSELYELYSKLPLKEIQVKYINDMMQPISSITDNGIILNLAKIDNNSKGINSLLGQLTYQMQKIVQAKDKSAASELEKKLEALRAADRIKMSPGERRNSLFYQHQLSFQDVQIDEIRAMYEGTDKWLKAPNGKNSNLNEKQWLEVRTPNFKNWFGDWENDPQNASKVLDENGEPQVVYHGTARADRVGNIFDPKRATSGPMAYFTDDINIAASYSKNKIDTSLSRDYQAYDDIERFTIKIGRSKYSLSNAWYYLDYDVKNKLKSNAGKITENDNGEIIKNENTDNGLGNYKNILSENKGNVLKALYDHWIMSGQLFGDRVKEFPYVLEKAGLSGVFYEDPDYREEKVYEVYLNIKHPFVTSNMSDDDINYLQNAGRKAQRKYDPEKATFADNWDKSNVSPEEWLEDLTNDIKEGTSYTWTRVPDWVTKTLKELGYDGIEDTGGKHGGDSHTVYIPFNSYQVKSAINNKGTFDSEKKNILFQDAQNLSLYGVHNLSEDALKHVIKIGGLANPSLAVADKDVNVFSNFGDISLIAYNYLIDKKEGRNAGTYGADIYSPRYPSITREVTDIGRNKIKSIFHAIDNEDFKNYIIDRIVNSIESYSYNSNNIKSVGFPIAYLSEKNVLDNIISKYKSELYRDEVIDEVMSLKLMDRTDFKDNMDATKKLSDIYIREVELPGYEALNLSEEDIKKNLDILYEYKEQKIINFNVLDEFLYGIKNIARQRGKIDYNATIDKAENYIKENNLTKDFNDWFEKTINKIDITEKIFNGFTPSGNRRYLAHTLENVSKYMKQESVRNGESFNYGMGSTRALVTPKFNTLKQIRANKSRIVDNNTFNEIKNELEDEYNWVTTKLKGNLSDYDVGVARFDESIEKGYFDAEYIKREYKDINLSDNDIQRIKEFTQALKEMPTEYFETKFTRPIYFEEFGDSFAAAVIPSNIDQSLKDELSKQNITLYEYKNSDEREKVTKDALDEISKTRRVLFQQRLLNETDIDRMQFQTLDELYNDARSFDTWQEFMDFYEVMGKPEVTPIPYDADAQFYQSTWELAHGLQTEQSQNEEEVANKVKQEGTVPTALDALFTTEIVNNDEKLMDFLHMAAYYDRVDLNSDEMKAQSAEDAVELERISQLKDFIDITFADRNFGTALSAIKGGNEVPPSTLQKIRTEMRDAFKTRDFRALYAEIMDDSEFAVDENDTISNQLKNRLSKYEKRYYDILRPNEDISRVSPERRKQISLEMDNRDIAAKLKSGSLKMDDEVYRYIKSLDKQIKDLERQYNNLEKETQNDYDRIAGAERRELLRLHDKLLIARSKYNKSNDEITRKINKGIKITDKYTRQSQNLKANYDELFRKYADLKNTIAIDQQVEEALKRQEEVHQVREDLNNKQKERNLTNETKKLRIQLVKRTMRRVPFDRIDYDSARTLIAIQRLFEPNLMGGVNRWIGTEGPYLRGVISGILTDEEYKKEIMDYMDKTRRSSQAYVEFKELLNNTKTIADFDKWTMKDRKRAALYLPKENWIRDLNLKQLAKEREESIDLPIELKEVKQPVYDEKGNVKKYKDENGEEHDATMTAWKITYSPEIGQMVQDAIGADMFNQLVNVPFADWTTEQLEQLAMRVNRIYTEGKDLLEAKKQAKKDKANEVRRQIEKVVNDTGIQINDDDTPEEKSRKREQINKILGINTNLKGTVANEQTGIKARINRLLHGYNDANVLRVARILDGQNEGVNVAQLYRREDECYRAKQTAINNRAKEIIDYMGKNNIKESDLSQVVTVNGVEYRIDELLYFLAANEDYEEDPVLLAKGKSGLDANDDYAATSRNAVMFGNMFSDTESLELKATWKKLDESTQRRIDDGELTPEEQSLLANNMFEKRPGTRRYIEACKERFGAVINAANQLEEKYKGLLKYISDDYAKQYDRMNENSIKEFNQPVHRVKCYVPLIRLESNGDTNVNQVKEDLLATMGASAGKQWVNKGMTKRRTGMSPLNQRPVQTGLYKTWSDSVERTEHFIAYSEYVNDLNRIYKSRDAVYTRNFIERRYGKGMISYIDDYINEVANPNANRIREAGAELLHTLRGRTAPAYLAWKASAIVKQGLTSPWPYMQFVNPAEYFSAAWKAITSKGKLYDAIRAKSVYMDNRIMDPMNDLIDELAESGKNKFDRAIGKQAQIGMKGLEWIDWVCVAPGWYACYEKKYAELNKNNQAVYESTKARLEEENAYEDVASSKWKTAEQIEALARKAMVDDVEKRAIEYADDCTRACQPSNRKVDIAPLFKNSSEAMKAYLQFQTSLNVIWQNLRYDLPYNLKKKQFAQITGCIIGYALAGIFMNSVMNGLGGDDDDDGNKADDILRNEIYYATTQFTDAIPMIGGDITNTMDKLITGKSGYSQSGTDMTPTVTKVLSIMTNARKGNWEKAAEMTAEGIGMYYGLPVSGIKEIGKLTGVGDLDGEAGINLGDVYGIADTGDE